MVLELATIDVLPGSQSDFERAFTQAQLIISAAKGYLGHQLQQCVEKDNRYVLLVHWETLGDHTEGFRNSPEFKQWRALIGPYFEKPPAVEHYRLKYEM